MNTRTLSPPQLSPQEACDIVWSNRGFFEDKSALAPLSEEYPTLARQLGKRALLFDATRNRGNTFKIKGAQVHTHALASVGIKMAYTSSAGNHAQGMALSGQCYDMFVHIGVPTSTPQSKLDPLRQYPNVQLHVIGETYDETVEWMDNQEGFGANVPAFDNRNVSIGQGTTLVEIVLQYRQLTGRDHPSALVVPVGGGGLLVGNIIQRDALGLTNKVHVIGVEAPGNDSMSRTLQHGGVLTRASKPNALFGGSCVGLTGSFTSEVAATASNVELLTANERVVRTIAADYLHDHATSGPGWKPSEPTTLQQFGAAVDIMAATNGDVVFINTGRNASPEVLLS